jgi:hypothetical protein
MTRQVLNNGESGSSARTKINANFTELYDASGDGGGGTWGSIGGTLSSQTDLAAALALKAPLADPIFTGAWRMDGGYGLGGIRAFADVGNGLVGVGLHGYGGSKVGEIVADNAGGISMRSGSVAFRLTPSTSSMDFPRFIANDANGGYAFAPLFVLDDASNHEGGFWCPKTSGSGEQYWGSDRTARVKLTRGGLLEVMSGATLVLNPAASVTPADSGNLVIQATSNTSLTFKLKGSDSVVRSGSITLS